MAKAVAKSKKIAAKSKPSAPARKAPPVSARKGLKKALAKVAAKPVAKAESLAAKAGKWVYTFGDGKAEGKAGLKDLLGGKGANLAEMANLGLPVPPGFTIPTSVCTYFYAHGKTYPKELKAQVEKALDYVGKLTGKAFGDSKNPLLVSVRSGGRASMPGMMDTVLNLGLNDQTVEKREVSLNARDVKVIEFTGFNLTEGANRCVIEVASGDFAADNKFYFTIRREAPAKALIVESASRGRSDSFYLQSALGLNDALPFNFVVKSAGAVDPSGIAENSLVILNDSPPQLARHILTRGLRLMISNASADHEFLRMVLSRAADLELERDLGLGGEHVDRMAGRTWPRDGLAVSVCHFGFRDRASCA
jgi:hypothetical protein